MSESRVLEERDGTSGFRVLVVAPGATTSTYDVFNYTLQSMRTVIDEKRVRGFYLHNSIMYHAYALKEAFPDTDEMKLIGMAQNRAAMDVITEVLMQRPDVVHIIDGTVFPINFYNQLFALRQETQRSFIVSIHLTEEPYASAYTTQVVNWVDVVFVNDAAAVKVFDPEGKRHIYYAPHSFFPGTHYPDYEAEKTTDVFMCGTMYRSRLDFLSQVNWDGINVKIVGLIPDREVVDPVLGEHITSGLMDNADVADCYRRCKVAINLHRTVGLRGEDVVLGSEDAYSVGPRVIEAAACGAFQITDHRQEVTDVFGDSIPVFHSPEEFESLIRWYIAHDGERLEKAKKSNALVQRYSARNRAMFMLEVFQEALLSVYEQRFGRKK